MVGWAISGTYFITDAFGDFGQPSGVSQEAYEMKLKQNWSVMYNENIKSLHFDVDYTPSGNNDIMQQYREEREVKIDNAYAAPHVNIQKLKF